MQANVVCKEDHGDCFLGQISEKANTTSKGAIPEKEGKETGKCDSESSSFNCSTPKNKKDNVINKKVTNLELDKDQKKANATKHQENKTSNNKSKVKRSTEVIQEVSRKNTTGNDSLVTKINESTNLTGEHSHQKINYLVLPIVERTETYDQFKTPSKEKERHNKTDKSKYFIAPITSTEKRYKTIGRKRNIIKEPPVRNEEYENSQKNTENRKRIFQYINFPQLNHHYMESDEPTEDERNEPGIVDVHDEHDMEHEYIDSQDGIKDGETRDVPKNSEDEPEEANYQEEDEENDGKEAHEGDYYDDYEGSQREPDIRQYNDVPQNHRPRVRPYNASDDNVKQAFVQKPHAGVGSKNGFNHDFKLTRGSKLRGPYGVQPPNRFQTVGAFNKTLLHKPILPTGGTPTTSTRPHIAAPLIKQPQLDEEEEEKEYEGENDYNYEENVKGTGPDYENYDSPVQDYDDQSSPVPETYHSDYENIPVNYNSGYNSQKHVIPASYSTIIDDDSPSYYEGTTNGRPYDNRPAYNLPTKSDFPSSNYDHSPAVSYYEERRPFYGSHIPFTNENSGHSGVDYVDHAWKDLPSHVSIDYYSDEDTLPSHYQEKQPTKTFHVGPTSHGYRNGNTAENSGSIPHNLRNSEDYYQTTPSYPEPTPGYTKPLRTSYRKPVTHSLEREKLQTPHYNPRNIGKYLPNTYRNEERNPYERSGENSRKKTSAQKELNNEKVPYVKTNTRKNQYYYNENYPRDDSSGDVPKQRDIEESNEPKDNISDVTYSMHGLYKTEAEKTDNRDASHYGKKSLQKDTRDDEGSKDYDYKTDYENQERTQKYYEPTKRKTLEKTEYKNAEEGSNPGQKRIPKQALTKTINKILEKKDAISRDKDIDENKDKPKSFSNYWVLEYSTPTEK